MRLNGTKTNSSPQETHYTYTAEEVENQLSHEYVGADVISQVTNRYRQQVVERQVIPLLITHST